MRKAGPSLSERTLSYEPVGMTLATGDWRAGLPGGFRGFERRARLGSSSVWTFTSNEVLRWGVKTRSGFAVEREGGLPIGPIPDATVVAGARYWLIAHLGLLRIREPVQVIAVVDEPDRKGFAYGTLTGHPVSGEEAFLLDRRPDGSVWLTVRSMTQPSLGIWRATYPLLPVAQTFYRRRYLRSLAS
ncbi:DUF1990 family protein [Actinopolymorpha alba]|uniref:DUF1990 family protein n=1 Tax=Actinopolymorpha alba TaxID=533267 RepID=UPI003B505ABD